MSTWVPSVYGVQARTTIARSNNTKSSVSALISTLCCRFSSFKYSLTPDSGSLTQFIDRRVSPAMPHVAFASLRCLSRTQLRVFDHRAGTNADQGIRTKKTLRLFLTPKALSAVLPETEKVDKEFRTQRALEGGMRRMSQITRWLLLSCTRYSITRLLTGLAFYLCSSRHQLKWRLGQHDNRIDS